ncbi:MAG: AMP-binding protein, partial [Burkholderiales bacterium]
MIERRGLRTQRRTYRQVVGMASQFARELEARGIGRGDRVLLWGPNSVEWVAAFWGCLLRGAVVVPMDQIAAPEFAARVIRQVDARLVLTTRERMGVDESRSAMTLEELEAQAARHPAQKYRAIELTRGDTAEIIFTSGTTAEPRGVVLTHGNLLANLEPLEAEIRKYRKWERWFHPLRFLDLLPLSHVFGQFLGVIIPPVLGATVVFQESLNPAEVMRTIQRERVSLVVTVPRLLETLRAKLERELEAEGRAEWLRREMQAAEGEKFVRRMWRFRRIHRRFGWKFWAFLSGGAALPAETEEFWMRLGFAVIQGYGLTETTSLVSVNHPFGLSKGSIGKVLAGREVKLDASGEILVRGESIASGYWEGAEMKKAEGEWLHTGD